MTRRQYLDEARESFKISVFCGAASLLFLIGCAACITEIVGSLFGASPWLAVASVLCGILAALAAIIAVISAADYRSAMRDADAELADRKPRL